MQRPPELGSLRAELRLAGVFEHRELRSWLKLSFMLAVLVLCFVGMERWGLPAALALIPVAAVFATSIAMLGHEGSHRSFSASPFRNNVIVHFAFPLFSGLGSLYWRNKHDRLHHGHPNVEGVDPDIQPWPFVASRGDHLEASPSLRWFQRHFQRWAFWPMTTLMCLGMRRMSILYAIKYVREHGVTKAWLLDTACMVSHYTLWMVVPSIIWGPLVGVGVYSLVWALVGINLALIFAPAHLGLPIVDEQNHDWLHQVETTRNLELPRVVSFFFIGLDYQVEHHLFPKIPHANLPTAARITADWCKRHGIAYHSGPYIPALVDTAKFMANAWTLEASDPVEVRAGLVGRAA